MASGIYGRSDLTANSWTEIASPPGSGIKVTTINITNRTDASKKVRIGLASSCLLYTSPSPRDRTRSRMPSSA